MYMWGPEFGWGMGWGWFGLMHLLWWVLLPVLAVLLYRAWRGGNRGEHGARRNTALDILRERYARGEIDENEYAQCRKHLEA